MTAFAEFHLPVHGKADVEDIYQDVIRKALSIDPNRIDYKVNYFFKTVQNLYCKRYKTLWWPAPTNTVLLVEHNEEPEEISELFITDHASFNGERCYSEDCSTAHEGSEVHVIEHALPIVKKILDSSLQFQLVNNSATSTQDANELFNEIIANLLSRLRDSRNNRPQGAIADLRGYIAATAYNACNLYLRQKYPRRSRLKNRLRYLLSHDAAFALWTNEASGLIGGFVEWRGKAALTPQRLLKKIRQDPIEWIQSAGLPSVGIDRAQLLSLLHALFQSCGGPIKLDELVNVVADICEEKDQSDEQLDTVHSQDRFYPTSEDSLVKLALANSRYGRYEQLLGSTFCLSRGLWRQSGYAIQENLRLVGCA